jgi:hypothetical protein
MVGHVRETAPATHWARVAASTMYVDAPRVIEIK